MRKPVFVVVLAFVLLLTAVEVGVVSDPTDPFEEPPDEELTVTCYKWVDNGSAAVYCPNKVYSPDAVVNITVEHCSEYEVQIDEVPPCERDRS